MQLPVTCHFIRHFGEGDAERIQTEAGGRHERHAHEKAVGIAVPILCAFQDISALSRNALRHSRNDARPVATRDQQNEMVWAHPSNNGASLARCQAASPNCDA